MMAKGTQYFLKTLVMLVLLTNSSCSLSRSMDSKFPIFPATAPIDIFRLDVIPEQKICVITDAKNSEEFITALSARYPDNWQKAPRVNLAPSYRMVTGTTEILILKQGIAILTRGSNRDEKVVVHNFAAGEAERLVRMACEKSAT